MSICPRCDEPAATLTSVHDMPTDCIQALQDRIEQMRREIDRLEQELSGERAAMGTIEELMFGEEA